MFKTLATSLTLCAAGAAFAQPLSPIQAERGSGAYLQDERGVVVRSESGLCWRGGQWQSAASLSGCDGALVVPVVKPTAPDIVAQPAPQVQPGPSLTPAPAPPVAQAPKRCDFTVTLESDPSFEFGKAQLLPAARKRVDQEIVARLPSCARVDAILIFGHADRLGPQRYNQVLSLARADAVAAYLKSKKVDVRIDTMGMGKTQPVKDCSDALRSKKLIACLAPNRRVVVEVRGPGKPQ